MEYIHCFYTSFPTESSTLRLGFSSLNMIVFMLFALSLWTSTFSLQFKHFMIQSDTKGTGGWWRCVCVWVGGGGGGGASMDTFLVEAVASYTLTLQLLPQH